MDALSPVRGLIVAALVGEPLPGDAYSELTLMWPTSLATDEHLAVVDAFVRFADTSVMDALPYAQQDTQFTADPIIWFERARA